MSDIREAMDQSEEYAMSEYRALKAYCEWQTDMLNRAITYAEMAREGYKDGSFGQIMCDNFIAEINNKKHIEF